MTTGASSQSLWQRVSAPLSSGPTAYAFLAFYVLICSFLLLTNPRTELSTDIVFVLFMLSMLVAYRARVATWFKVVLGVIALGIVLPYFGTLNPFYIDVATQAGIFTALALGLNVVVGFAGLLDLGYVAFFAVGAYAWGIFSTTQISNINPAWGPVDPVMFYPFLIIGLILGLITGVLLGLPVLRLRGDYLAIVTLGFGEVIRVVANNLDRPINITNGSQGIRDIERPPLVLVDLVRKLVDDHVVAVVGHGCAFERVVPRQDHLALLPRLTGQHLALLVLHPGLGGMHTVHHKGAGVDQHLAQPGVVVGAPVEQQQASLGRNRHADFIGDD